MKTLPFSVLISALCGISNAATVNAFWSFQDDKADGNFSLPLTATTFGGTAPSITTGGSVLRDGGGAGSFVSYEGGTPWLGSGSFASPGHSLAWDPGSTGNTMSIFLDMTNTFDLSLRSDVRSAEAGSAPRSNSFSAIEYRFGNGAYTSTGSPLTLGIGASNNFQTYSLDLSGLSAIENRSQVEIRFTIPEQTGSSPTSFRLDNIQLTADLIPEPSVAVLSALGALALLRRRRCA